ncbi:MAG: hypothetical protein AAGI46_15070 [Planctomycetota bacterium]
MDDRHDHNGRSHRPHNNGSDERPLSAISHLFLSDLREPEPAPTRDTGEDFVAVLGTGVDASLQRRAAAVAATLLGPDVDRVGLAFIEGNALSIVVVDGDTNVTEVATEDGDVETILAEVACDVDAWVVALPDPRLPQSRRLLKLASRWTLVAGSDHESVVGGYRTLKGLCDRPGLCDHQPRVSLAIPDAAHPAEAERAARKLLGVCRQFLELDVEVEGPSSEGDSDDTPWHAHEVWHGRWQTAAEAGPAFDALVATLQGTSAASESTPSDPRPTPMRIAPPVQEEPASIPTAHEVTPIHNIPSIAQPMPTPEPVAPAVEAPVEPTATSDEEDVIDFPSGANVTDLAIARDRSLAATPVTPPMLPNARLAVANDGGLMLVAAAQPGLSDLAKVGEAMAWVSQNRQLLAMALGQFRLNEHVPVKVRLLVAHADAGADALRPLLGTGDVTICAYRRLRWGGREGLLLDAA